MTSKNNMYNNVGKGKYLVYMYYRLINNLIIIYNNINSLYLIKEKMLFSIDMLYIYIWFNNIIKKHKYEYKSNISLTSKLNMVNDYFNKKLIIICTYEYKFFIQLGKWLFFNNLGFKKNFKKPYKGLFIFLYKYFYEAKFILIGFSKSIEGNWIRSSMKSINRFMLYTFKLYNYYTYISFKKINFLKSRNIWNTRKLKIIGYKFKFSGRFSRKQRAGHMWYSKGRYSLNSIYNYIDYAYWTLPLVNSAITIRLWINHAELINKDYLSLWNKNKMK
jgi:hypothetical protein